MAKPLKEWLDNDVAKIRELETSKGGTWIYENLFTKDPHIPTFIDNSIFYSPASGTIFNQKVVNPRETLLDIKGIPYTLQDLMQDKSYNKKSLVIQIFLTYMDTHICRIPYSGLMQYEYLPPITTKNKSMLFVEDDLFNNKYNPDNMEYAFLNERVKVKVIIPHMSYNYYMVLLADRDVNVISFMQPNNSVMVQNDRFGIIKFGSEANLILPLDDDLPFEWTLSHPNLTHVEVGEDELVKIKFDKLSHRQYY